MTHLSPEMPCRHQKKGGAQSPWLLLMAPGAPAAGVVAAPDLHLCLHPQVWSAPQGGEVS